MRRRQEFHDMFGSNTYTFYALFVDIQPVD